MNQYGLLVSLFWFKSNFIKGQPSGFSGYHDFCFKGYSAGLSQVRKWEKNSFKSGKCQGILFWGENGHFKEKSDKLKQFSMADWISEKAGRKLWGHCTLNNIFPYWGKEKYLLKTYQP